MQGTVVYLTVHSTFRRSRLHSARWVVVYAGRVRPIDLHDAVEDADPDVLLVDAELLDWHRFADVEAALQQRSVIVVAPHSAPGLLAAVLRARAMGTLYRSDGDAMWDDTVQRVMGGEPVFPAGLFEALCAELVSRLRPEPASVPQVHTSWPSHPVRVH
jgi:DNA-binding NarL/FixJ family response regulator